MAMPKKPPKLNLFCLLWYTSPDPLNLLTGDQKLAMVRSSGYLSDELRTQCSWMERFYPDEAASCYKRKMCDESAAPMEAAPAQSSNDQYMEATGHLTEIPRLLHSSLVSNLLRPCRLVHSQLCGNAEAAGILMLCRCGQT